MSPLAALGERLKTLAWKNMRSTISIYFMRLLRSEPIFYALSGVFAGGGVERIASILAEHANAPQGVPIPILDIILALLLIVVGLFFALVADETEKYEASVTRQTDLARLRIVVDAAQAFFYFVVVVEMKFSSLTHR